MLFLLFLLIFSIRRFFIPVRIRMGRMGTRHLPRNILMERFVFVVEGAIIALSVFPGGAFVLNGGLLPDGRTIRPFWKGLGDEEVSTRFYIGEVCIRLILFIRHGIPSLSFGNSM